MRRNGNEPEQTRPVTALSAIFMQFAAPASGITQLVDPRLEKRRTLTACCAISSSPPKMEKREKKIALKEHGGLGAGSSL